MKEMNKTNTYMEENIFLNLSYDMLKVLWEEYKNAVYIRGWYEKNSPMLPYIMKYENKCPGGQGSGRKMAEINLLEAIAIYLFKENKL